MDSREPRPGALPECGPTECPTCGMALCAAERRQTTLFVNGRQFTAVTRLCPHCRALLGRYIGPVPLADPAAAAGDTRVGSGGAGRGLRPLPRAVQEAVFAAAEKRR
jgi:hypothetical protein